MPRAGAAMNSMSRTEATRVRPGWFSAGRSRAGHRRGARVEALSLSGLVGLTHGQVQRRRSPAGHHRGGPRHTTTNNIQALTDRHG
jgi:hypothetical protein